MERGGFLKTVFFMLKHNIQLQQETRWVLQEKHQGVMTREAQKDIERLKKGEPVDYIIGFVPFLGCRIDLSKRPFIPRPETEYWVGRAVEEIKAKGDIPITCLDIFAGSGCIGIALLKNLPFASVDFIEREGECIEQIKINLRLNGIVPSRYRVIESNMFAKVRGTYDYMLANPPYVSEKRKKNIQASVKKWEPMNAILAEHDGLVYIKKLLKEAPCYLEKGGAMYIEFDAPQKRELARMIPSFGYRKMQFFKDQFGKWRYVRIMI